MSTEAPKTGSEFVEYAVIVCDASAASKLAVNNVLQMAARVGGAVRIWRELGSEERTGNSHEMILVVPARNVPDFEEKALPVLSHSWGAGMCRYDGSQYKIA